MHTRIISKVEKLSGTLKLIRCSYDSDYFHADLCVFGFALSHSPPHFEKQVTGIEAVCAQTVTERVLRAETHLQTAVWIVIGLRRESRSN